MRKFGWMSSHIAGKIAFRISLVCNMKENKDLARQESTVTWRSTENKFRRDVGTYHTVAPLTDMSETGSFVWFICYEKLDEME